MTDPLRPGVVEVVELGRMPTSEQADLRPVVADRWEALAGELFSEGSVTDAEAEALVGLFPEDDSDCYGIAWTLLHVVESAPGWPLKQALAGVGGPWAEILRERANVTPAS